MRADHHRARRLHHHRGEPLGGPIVDRFADRRERRHRETRDEILLAAREVLLERGAADLSLREIARRAGFTPGALYKYFDSKDDVVKALADRAMGALLEALAAVPSELPPDERAVEIGLAYLEFARHNPEDVAIVTMHESVAVGPALARTRAARGDGARRVSRGRGSGRLQHARARRRRVHDVRRVGACPGPRHARAASAARDRQTSALAPAAPAAGVRQRPEERMVGAALTRAVAQQEIVEGTMPSTDRRRKRLTLACMCFALFMVMLDSTVVNLALKTIQLKMHASYSEVQWIVDAFVLALASLLLTGGTLGDLFGRRRAFISRPRAVHRRLGHVRPGAVDLVSHRLARRAGRRRRPHAAEHAVDHHQHLPRPPRARSGDRHVGRHLGPRAGHRPADRRHAGRPLRLAEHLLDQRADRGRRPRHGAAVRARVVGPRRSQPRPARPGHGRDRPRGPHLRVHRGQHLRLDVDPHRRRASSLRPSRSASSSSSSCAAARRCCSSSSSATARSAAPTWSA